MSRFELGGKGDPIPLEALPDPSTLTDLPPLILALEDGTSFEKADYASLGYTHFEVTCIGASGGYGSTCSPASRGSSLSGAMEPNLAWLLTVLATGEFRHTSTDPYPDNDDNNRSYWYTKRTYRYHDAYLPDPYLLKGGAPGGGGLHVVTGLLDDLPDSVPVAVGEAGDDGPFAQIGKNTDAYSGLATSKNTTYIWPERDGETKTEYVAPFKWFEPPRAGYDGGGSFFGTIAKASGGKGGEPAVVWSGSNLFIRGNGAEGGLGNRGTPGGGGAGSSTTANGQDGTWDGVVGGGGGGGRGGASYPGSGVTPTEGVVYGDPFVRGV